MWQTVILVFYVNCFSQAGDSCDLYFGAQDDWLSQIAHHLREDKWGCDSCLGGSHLFQSIRGAVMCPWGGHARWKKPVASSWRGKLKNRCQSPRAPEWCANKQVEVTRQVLRLAYLALPASGNLPNLVWVSFGGALRDFRRNGGFHINQENLWSSVDLLLAYLVHLRASSDEGTG